MNFDKFTLKLQSAIEEAAGEAQREKHSEVTPAHIIKALTEQKDGVLRPLFEKLGVSPDSVIQSMDKILAGLPKLYGDAQVSFSRSAARILSACDKTAAEFKDEYISAEHFLIALLTDECPEKDALIALGVSKDEVLKALQAIRGNQRITSQDPEAGYQSLDKFCKDLTRLALADQLDPVI